MFSQSGKSGQCIHNKGYAGNEPGRATMASKRSFSRTLRRGLGRLRPHTTQAPKVTRPAAGREDSLLWKGALGLSWEKALPDCAS